MKPILEVQNVSKKFRINHEHQSYLSLRDSITSFFKTNLSTEDFWALNNVSFEVMPGDTLGIVGTNGAGKSTLLKILSKITPPTSGKIIARGRIASLLEVGTGFHPELSGRENVFMNGSILGMRRVEILKNFDAIVDFAGVEKFIDTPLKHYSSGMQLRLAFAVAAFLENEILIIDEVLAVGDAEFQKKCMGKMGDVSRDGRTILFVSHNMGAVTSLCKTGMWMYSGENRCFGNISMIVKEYLNTNSVMNVISPNSKKELFIADFFITNKSNYITSSQTKVIFVIEIFSKNDNSNVHVGLGINDLQGYRLFTPFSMHVGERMSLKKGTNYIYCEIDALPLRPDYYNVEIYLGDGFNVFDYQKNNIQFEVVPSVNSNYRTYPDNTQGNFLISQKWKIS